MQILQILKVIFLADHPSCDHSESVLGGVFVLKSGLRILIRAPEVPFSVPPKTPKMGVFGYFGGTEFGTSGALIKILRPLFNTNTPPKTPI